MRRWITILLILMFSLSACGRFAAPSDGEETATMTATPMLQMSEIEARTLTAAAFEEATPTPTATVTQVTVTLLPTASPSPQPQPTATLDNQSAISTVERYFEVQPGSPVAMPNWAHADAGCDWLGVAGQVFNLDGQPEASLIIQVGGKLNGQSILGLALTGLDSVYGPGGYEVELGDETVASQKDLWVQIKNGTGESISDPIFVDTFDDCSKNLILLNFVETTSLPPALDRYETYLPVIIR